jgi:MoaA/NifB/PqqE/SkfB family radical SAM enzyme
MGFPKPYPTQWPDPADYPDIPISPDTFPPSDDPLPGDPDEYGTIEPMPEYSHFYAVTWAVNHACNLKCTHCYDVVPDVRKDLSTSSALSLISHLAAAGVTFIAFSGGEAFLRKDLFQLMEHCLTLGMTFGARSNGTRITPSAARRLRELGISVVGVSFDGATPETHNAVRGQGAFDEAVAGLKALRSEGIRAQMEVVLSRHNIHEALDFISLGESLDASEVNFSTMAPQGNAKLRMNDLLDHQIWRQVTDTLRQASTHAKIPVTPNCALTGRCVANLEPHITCDGWMTPCYLSAHKLFNVLDTPSEQIRTYLDNTRLRFQDVCGRTAWTKPNSLVIQTQD